MVISLVEITVFPKSGEDMLVAALIKYWDQYSNIAPDIFKQFKLKPQHFSAVGTPDYDGHAALQRRLAAVNMLKADARVKLDLAKKEPYFGVCGALPFPGQVFDLYTESLFGLSDGLQSIADAMWAAEEDMMTKTSPMIRFDNSEIRYNDPVVERKLLGRLQEVDGLNPLVIADSDMYRWLQEAGTLIQENCVAMREVLEQGGITRSGTRSLEKLTASTGPLRKLGARYDFLLCSTVQEGVIRYPNAKITANHSLHQNLSSMADCYRHISDAICGVREKTALGL